MPIKNFTGGIIADVAGPELNRYLIQSAHVIKASNQSITSSTTLQNDSQLLLQVSANTDYWMMALLLYQGATAGDLKIGFSGPSGATLNYVTDGLGVSATGNADQISRAMFTIGSGPSIGAIDAADSVAIPKGLLRIGSSGGTFRFRFAQVTSNATSTTIKSGSMLMIRRLTT